MAFTGVNETGKTRALLEVIPEVRKKVDGLAGVDGAYIGFNKTQPWDSKELRPDDKVLSDPDQHVTLWSRWLSRRLHLLLTARRTMKTDCEPIEGVYYAPANMEKLVEQTTASRRLSEAEDNVLTFVEYLLNLCPECTAELPFVFVVLVDEIQKLPSTMVPLV